MLNKNKITQLSSVVVFSLIISIIASLGINNNAEKVVNNNIEENIDTESETIEVAEITKEYLTAGVSLQLENYLNANHHLGAGVTSEIIHQSFIVGNGSSEEVVAEEVVEEEVVEEENYGYNNLGIANITYGNLNIRDEASSDGKVVGKMTKHNACEILSEEDGWYKIKSGKVRGYVSCEYIITGDEAKAIAAEEASDIATVINTPTLRIRYEASTESKTLQLIGKGEDMLILEFLDGWYKVEADDDKEGYVSAEYIEVSKQLPVAKEFKEVKKSNTVSDTRAALVDYACQFIGNRYVWGGTSLTNGVDCSGFTMQVYKKFGVKLPHYSASQPAYGKKISAKDARPGDLFFYGNKKIGHVAIYIGNGKIVHAASKRSGIKISNAFYRTPKCVVSYLP